MRLHRAAAFAVCALALIVSACGEREGGGQTDPAEAALLRDRAADAPRAEAEISTRFEYLRYRVNVEDATPSLCLVFSGPLDPERDYAPFLRIDPETPLALSVNGQTLCLGGVDFGTSYDVTLREGLPAEDGRTLAFDQTTTLEFGDRPAYVGFSGGGVILPRIEADGIPIETVNVDSVAISVFQITDRALAFRSISQGFTAGEGEYDWLYGEESPDGVARLIWEGEMDTGGNINAPNVTVMPLASTIGDLRPGAYFMRVTDAGVDEDERQPARAARWFVITDLALTGYTGSDGIDVTVRSLQTARPQDDVRIELVARSNEILATRTTANDGRVSFDGPIINGSGDTAPRMVFAYGPQGDFAVLDLDRSPVDLSEDAVGGRDAPEGADAFLYLDRGIYRPGETVHMTGLIRDSEARAISDRPGSVIVYAPNGIENQRFRFETAPEAGAVQFDFDVPRAAARGIWRMALDVDGLGVVGRVSFSVEDFVPQRIALEIETDSETPVLAGETRAIEADVRFLYGAPGAGLPVEGEVRIEADFNPFPAYSDYSFGRHDEDFRERTFDLTESIADGSGHATLLVDPDGEGDEASRPLRLRAVVRAIEPGGRPVADDVRIPYRPRERYLGLDPQFENRSQRDQTASFGVIALDALGTPVTTAVEWRLIRIDYRYDWYREDNGPWRWRRTRNVVTIEDGVQQVGPEGASIETPPLDWGSYQLIVTDPLTGVESSDAFWVGWGSQPVDGVEAPDRVSIATPDSGVRSGRQAEITILAPYAGIAEVVVATDRVIESRTVDVGQEGARVSLPVTADWGAGAYVMVTVYTPRDPVAQPRPRRAVGVAYIPVDVADRTLDLTLDTPEVVRPRQPLTVTVEAEGNVREAYLTLAAVDEGILLLTRFQSPDPVEHFFGRKRLAVDMYDDYGRLLDPNQGAAAEVRSGGDQIGGAGLTVVPTRTVALFQGPVRFNGNGRAEIELDIPDFNGELRLMAVAWTPSGLGSASQPLTVRDEVPSELILPRFLAPDDTAFGTATLDNVEGEAGTYTVTIDAGAGLSVTEPEFPLELSTAERRDAPVEIAAGETGVTTIGITVAGPDFAVQRSYPIQVRSAFLPVSRVNRTRVMDGANYSPDPNVLDGFVDGSGSVQVSFSALPMDAAALYESLSRYPYGCTEQQVSRAMPLLYADQMAALGGVESDSEIRRRVADAVETILNRQSADGAIGQWRMGDRNANPWLGAYAVDFLARAREQGYAVPDAALDRAYTVLDGVSRLELWRASGYETQVRRGPWQYDTQDRLNHRSAAYALYVLARAGRVDRAQLRYMHDRLLTEIESPMARAHIGAGLAMIGDQARSRSAFNAAVEALGYNNAGDWYQTPRRDIAGVLALAAEAGNDDIVTALTERVATDLPEPDRLTTQEKAFLLLAARALVGDTTEVNVPVDGDAEMVTANRTYRLDAAQLAGTPVFTNRTGNPVWMTQIARGAPIDAPPAVSENLRVSKMVLTPTGATADLANVTQGDRFIVAITVTGTEQRRAPIVIADLLPAGFEIEAVLEPQDGGSNGVYSFLGDLASANIAEARDDRFVAAIDLYERRGYRLAYVVRAVTPGDFVIPGANAEDMYRMDVFARSEAGRVTIRPRS
ncbi:MAG: alpha-2-macroglobulin [Maricaulis sp.]|nr:alpha-2-macroglobulin [Maricaulis sp.]